MARTSNLRRSSKWKCTSSCLSNKMRCNDCPKFYLCSMFWRKPLKICSKLRQVQLAYDCCFATALQHALISWITLCLDLYIAFHATAINPDSRTVGIFCTHGSIASRILRCLLGTTELAVRLIIVSCYCSHEIFNIESSDGHQMCTEV